MATLPADHPAHSSDAELLARVAQADRDSFLALYDRYSPRLLGLIRTLVYSRPASEDVLQTVMLEVWSKHAARYNPALGPVDAWLLRLARSRAIDHVRSEARRRGETSEGLDSGGSEPAPAMDFSDSAALQRAMNGLDAELKVPLMLAYVKGLSREQIAEHLGLPVGTVKTRIRKAVSELREALAPAGVMDA